MECCGYGVINTENCARRKNSGGFKSSNFDFFFDRNQNIFQALTG